MKIFKNLKPYLPLLILTILLTVGQVLLELQIPKQNIQVAIALDLIGLGQNDAAIAKAWQVGGAILLYSLADALVIGLSIFFSSKMGSGFAKTLRAKIYAKVQQLSINEIDQLGTASLITRTTNDVMQLQQLVTMGFRLIILSPLMLIGGLIQATTINNGFSVVYAIAIPIIILVVGIIIAKTAKIFISIQKKTDKLTAVSRENLTGVRVIRAFNQQEYETEKYTAANADVRDTSINANRKLAMLFPASNLIMNLTSVAILVVAMLMYNGQTGSSSELSANVGATSAIISYSGMILFSLISMAFIFMVVPRALASASRINEILDMPITITNNQSTTALPIKQTNTLTFKDVCYAYPNAKNNVLNNINFSISSGKTLAIIGSTGSGKSTVANLIPRLADVTCGEILLNDVNINNLLISDLRNVVGFVPQSAVLFSGTIRDNLKIGKTDATDDEIIAAAKVAQAHDFISNTPDGYDHVLSQGGKNLSGGQKQRLSIARAIVKHPMVYVFDDSFSALDFKTDANLRKALNKVTKADNSIVVIVAQRVATVMNADTILVLENGNMVGAGSHKQLMKDCQQYKEIVLSQLNEEEAKNERQ